MSNILLLDAERSPTWTLASGLKLIRAIQPEVRKVGYHIALGGGVLNKGLSYKDLDIYCLPMMSGGRQPKSDVLVKLLESLWGPGRGIGEGNYPEEAPYVAKLGFSYADTRVEVFILGAPAEGGVKGEGERINDEINSRGPELQQWVNDGNGVFRNIGGTAAPNAVEGIDGVWRRPAGEDGIRGTYAGIRRNPTPTWTVSNEWTNILRTFAGTPASQWADPAAGERDRSVDGGGSAADNAGGERER